MAEHKPGERIETIMDVSQFDEFYKMAKIAIEGMRSEVDKGVTLAGGKFENRRECDRRKQND